MSGGGGFFSPSNLLSIGATLVAPEFAPTIFGAEAAFGERLLANMALGGGISALTGGDVMTGALGGGLSSALRSPEMLSKLGFTGTPASTGANVAGAMKGPSVAGGDVGIGSLLTPEQKYFSMMPEWSGTAAQGLPAAAQAGQNFMGAPGILGQGGNFGFTADGAAQAAAQAAPQVAQAAPQSLIDQGVIRDTTFNPVRNLANSSQVYGGNEVIPSSAAVQDQSLLQKYKWPIIGGVATAGLGLMTPQQQLPVIGANPNVPRFGLASNYRRTENQQPVYPTASYAEGGIAQLADGGRSVAQPANVDFMGGDMFPQSQQQRSLYATPSQMPTSAQQVMASYEPKTNPLTGQPTVNMADGGATSDRQQIGMNMLGPVYADTSNLRQIGRSMSGPIYEDPTIPSMGRMVGMGLLGPLGRRLPELFKNSPAFNDQQYMPSTVNPDVWNDQGYAQGLTTATQGNTQGTPAATPMASGGIAQLAKKPERYAIGGAMGMSSGLIDPTATTSVAAPIQQSAAYTASNPVQPSPSPNVSAAVPTAGSSGQPTFAQLWSQNVGGQFKDPYQNYLMQKGASADIPSLLAQYQAGGGKGTPDWAAPNARLDVLSTKWDASGATPVDYLRAWNRTTPTTNTAPQGYFDALDAYNTGMSLWNPQTAIGLNQYDPAKFANYNAAAYNAMRQGIYDRMSPVYQNYMPPSGGTIEGSHGSIPNAGWISSYGAQGMASGGIADLQQQEATKRMTSELPHIVPTASARGGMLRGGGDGMSDSIPGTITGKNGVRPARLADGEFVIPADVVSHLGNGSTDAGAKQLYAMMDKVRKARTGTKKQGKQINPRKLMPA